MNYNKKIMIYCFVLFFLLYGAQGSYTPYMSSYYQLNGMSKIEIGLVSCIGPIVAITIQPLWGILSDKTKKRKQILQLLSLMTALVMPLYFLSNSAIFLILFSFLYTSFAMAMIPLLNAIITKTAREHNFEYSQVRIGGPIGHMLMPLVVSAVLGVFSKSMFVFAFILYFLLFIVITFSPNEIFDFKDEEVKNSKTNTSKMFDSYEVVFIFTLAVLNTFGNTLLNTYVGPKILDMGYSQSLIGTLTFILSLGEFPVLILMRKFTRKFKAITLMNFALSVSALRLILASSDSIVLIGICQLIEGLTYMVAFYTSVVYISNHCVSGYESRAQSILVVLESGVGAVIANIFGGILISNLGIINSFRIMAIFLVIILILINFLRKFYLRKTV